MCVSVFSLPSLSLSLVWCYRCLTAAHYRQTDWEPATESKLLSAADEPSLVSSIFVILACFLSPMYLIGHRKGTTGQLTIAPTSMSSALVFLRSRSTCIKFVMLINLGWVAIVDYAESTQYVAKLKQVKSSPDSDDNVPLCIVIV